MHALLVTYGLTNGTPLEHTELCDELHPAFAALPGLVSFTGLANADTGRFGAFFLFDAKAAFDRFVASELYAAVYASERVAELTASDFSVTAKPGVPSSGDHEPGRASSGAMTAIDHFA